MLNKLKMIAISLLVVVANTQALPISGAYDQLYPSKTVSGMDENTVSLTKEVQWTGNKNEALVDITFSGLEYVKEEAVPTDVIFVVDTSRSMVEAGGVVNPDHSFHLMEPVNAKLSINKMYYADIDALIEPYIKESNENSDVKDSVVVQVGEDWKSGTGFKYYIDPQIKIKIPHSLAVAMWPTYIGIENEDIYLVPTMYSGLSEANTYLSYTALPNNASSKVWSAVDFNKEIKADAKDHNNDFPGNSYLSFYPSNIYQKDSKGNRYVDSVHPVDSFGCNDDCYQNYAWLPLTRKRVATEEKVTAINLDGEDAIYDENGVPRSWYQSTKDKDGNRTGQYQRAHLLYDVIEYFVKEIDTFGADSRFAYASFNTKSNGEDINGKPAVSQQTQSYINSSGQFLESLEQSISHSGEEKFQEAMGMYGKDTVSTQGTNYHSGLLAARNIMESDSLIDSDRNKVFIFISDGQPNYVMYNPNPAGDSSGLIQDALSAGGQSEIDYYHEIFANQILKGKFSNYKSFGIGLQENDSQYIKDRLSIFIEAENISVLETKDNENMEFNFKKIFDNIKNTSIERTKLVSIEDTIDSRYFEIDVEKLNSEGQNYYPSEYSNYEIEDVIIDGIKHQKIVFDFEIKDLTVLEQKVRIPLLKLEASSDDNYEGFIPTNYDTKDSKGAKSDYIGLDGFANSVETERVWLPTNELVISKVSSDATKTTLSGAEFELYYHNSKLKYNDATYVTDSNGEISIGLLPPGKYNLIETKAPKDHQILQEIIELDLSLKQGPVTQAIEVVNELLNIPEPPQQFSSINVSKEVVDLENKGEIKEFEFTFIVDSDRDYPIEINGFDQGNVSSGEKFLLKDGDIAQIKNMEVGLNFKIIETQTIEYTSNFENNTYEARIETESIHVDFVNTVVDDDKPEVPVDPEEPEQPEEPGEELPETPEQPEEPGEEVPETPEQPEEPGEQVPETPEQPEDPGEQQTSKPDKDKEKLEPKDPTVNDKGEIDGGLPETGVKPHNYKLSYTLLLIGMIVLVVSTGNERKRKKK